MVRPRHKTWPPDAPQHSIRRLGLKIVIRPGRYRAGRGLRSQLTIAKAVECMVIDHACRLHESVADSRAHKVEAAFLQIFTHRVRFRGAGGEALPRLPGVHSRLASGELP